MAGEGKLKNAFYFLSLQILPVGTTGLNSGCGWLVTLIIFKRDVKLLELA